MTRAMLTRASLGHSGRALKASLATIILYAAMLIAARPPRAKAETSPAVR